MVTGMYAGFSALLMLYLSWRVVRERQRCQVGLGDGGDPDLQRAMRVHANFVEYTPLALVMLLAYEISGANPLLVHAFGAALLLSRILHARGFGRSAGYSRGRFFGTLGTWIVLALLGVALIERALFG
ncbi:MAG: hypothetical protein EBR51_00830 [Gammaproteobacteria bacterium]|jgi:uncharacterized membrane protein YecN with MAPEG domain|nr:hypothetical protein [Gammaproteobacteria bacterium]